MSYAAVAGRAAPYVLFLILFLYVVLPDQPYSQPQGLGEFEAKSYNQDLKLRLVADSHVQSANVKTKSSRLSAKQKTEYRLQQAEAVKTLLSKKNKDKPVLAFVIIQPPLLQRLGRSMWHTWMKDILPFSDIIVYATDCSVIKEMAKSKYPLDKKMEDIIQCISSESYQHTEFSV